MTAKYESLFQKEEQASKLELAQTIRKQKAELDKMVPVQFHTSRTIFPDNLRPIPGFIQDGSTVPPTEKGDKKGYMDMLEDEKDEVGESLEKASKSMKETFE